MSASLTPVLSSAPGTDGGGPAIRTRAGRMLDSRGGAPLIAGLVAFAVSAFRLTRPEIWYDETATITSASRSLGQLFFEAQHVDAVHTFYYSIIHVVFAVFGYSPLSLRLPSAIAIGLTAAFTVVLARQFGDPRRALLAGLVISLLPRAIWAGGEGRGYAGTALLAVLLTIVLVKAVRSPLRRWWVVYACVAFISCLYFAFIVFLVLAHAVTVLYLVIRDRRAALRTTVSWAIAAAVAGSALIPFAFLVRSEASQVSWIGRFSVKFVYPQVVYEQWFTTHAILYSQLLWIFTIAGCLVLAWKSTSFSLASVVIPAAFVPTAGMILYTIVSKPIYNDRYVTMCVPFVAILIASAMSARLRWTPLIAVFLVFFVVLLLPEYGYLRSTYAKQTANWEGTASYVEKQRALLPPDGRVGMIWGPAQITRLKTKQKVHTQQVIQEAYPGAFERSVNVTLKRSGAERGQLWQSNRPLSESLGRLVGIDTAIYVGAQIPDLAPETSSVMEQHGWHAVRSWSANKIRVVEYQRNGTSPAA